MTFGRRWREALEARIDRLWDRFHIEKETRATAVTDLSREVARLQEQQNALVEYLQLNIAYPLQTIRYVPRKKEEVDHGF